MNSKISWVMKAIGLFIALLAVLWVMKSLNSGAISKTLQPTDKIDDQVIPAHVKQDL